MVFLHSERREHGAKPHNKSFKRTAKSAAAELCERWDRTNELLERLTNLEEALIGPSDGGVGLVPPEEGKGDE
jgi:hypothetical protein